MIEKILVDFLKFADLEEGYLLKLYVPWAVLDELDKLKMAGKRTYNPNMELETNARKAIAFLNKQLLSKSKMVSRKPSMLGLSYGAGSTNYPPQGKMIRNETHLRSACV